MTDLKTWLWAIAAIIIWSIIAVEDAWPATLRVEHTSRINGSVIVREIIVENCVRAVAILRSRAIGKLRTWCDNRRI